MRSQRPRHRRWRHSALNCWRARSDALAQIKLGWAERLAALRDWFARTLSLEPCPFNRTKLQPRRVHA